MSHFPTRLTVCTYNIWTWTRWPERRAALQQFAATRRPDILCLQEVQAESLAALDETLGSTHDRVNDSFTGWSSEGNIYWDRSLFERVEFGAEQIGIIEEFRRLFWARLRVLDGTNRTLLVATAHYTWHGHQVALETEKNVRMPQARETVRALAELSHPDEPVLFMGDLNDTTEPIRILRDGGFADCFTSLGSAPINTWPALPTTSGPQQTIDWMMHRGPIRPINAEVIDFYHVDLAPSDHKPILATYAL